MDYFEPTSTIVAFADDLRQARLFKQVSLDEVAVRTKVRPDFLAALESGSWEEIPAAYVRGYVSLYAQAVGMNRDKVLAQFDRLFTAAPAKQSGAELGAELPLIERPQHVELPRAKIRAAWFAALTRNRGLSYLLSALLIVGGATGLYWSKGQSSAVPDLLDFQVAVEQNRARLHAPHLLISVDSSALQVLHDARQLKTVTFVAVTGGRIGVNSPGISSRDIRCAPYDTITFQYLKSLALTADPIGCGTMYDDRHEVVRGRTIDGHTMVFEFGNAEIGDLDSAGDTLGKGVSS
ncbi:helix-turn-helix domain-containing protein [candidate division KSB1 bacterium]|nr:helix-turn-helix domain-containing protein [candidate division KSB1 bacterium]